jgi:hypothetical protein
VESEISIEANDGKKIFGTLNREGDDCDRLIVFVHGLSDNRNHRIVFNASKFFRKNFDTFRPSLYSAEKGARSLDDCSIGTFVEDMNTVIYEFQEDYDEIFLVCHSLGFVVMDCDLSQVDGLILWDPALSLEEGRIQNMEYKPELNSYLINWGVTYLINNQLKIDWENVNDERLIRNLDVPVSIIMAGRNDLKKGWKQKLDGFKVDYKFLVIEGASHGFVKEGIEDKLFEKSMKWLESKSNL